MEASATVSESGWSKARALLGRVPQRRWVWLAIVLGCGINMQSLQLGRHADDYLQGWLIERHLSGEGTGYPWYEIFGVRNRLGEAGVRHEIEQGVQPWWADLQQSRALFRPVSAATHYLDYALWPHAYWAMHLQNLFWYALLIACVAKIFFAMASTNVERSAAALALCLYAIDDAHAATVDWIAARNTIICGALAVLMLHYHHAAYVARRLASRAAPFLLAAALLSSEGAVAIWGYLLSHALCVDVRKPVRRLTALSPLLLVTLLWQLAYRVMGFGVHGSGVYLDPFADSLEFLRQLPERASMMLLDQFGLPSALIGGGLPPLVLFVASWVMCALVLVVLSLRLLRERATIERFWFFGCIFSIVPYCVFFPEPRLAIIPSIGSVAVLASWIVNGVRAVRAKLATRALVLVLALVHLPLSAALAVARIEQQRHSDWIPTALAGTFPTPDVGGKWVFVVSCSNFLIGSWSIMARMGKEPKPAGMYMLGSSEEPVRLTRTALNAFRLEPQFGYLREPTSLWVRSPRVRFQTGFSARVGPATVQVERVTSDGRPASIMVSLPEEESRNALWYEMVPGFVPLILPPVGESIELCGERVC